MAGYNDREDRFDIFNSIQNSDLSNRQNVFGGNPEYGEQGPGFQDETSMAPGYVEPGWDYAPPGGHLGPEVPGFQEETSFHPGHGATIPGWEDYNYEPWSESEEGDREGGEVPWAPMPFNQWKEQQKRFSSSVPLNDAQYWNQYLQYMDEGKKKSSYRHAGKKKPIDFNYTFGGGYNRSNINESGF